MPRPREGGDAITIESNPVCIVSIHAPARGRLGRDRKDDRADPVSIHAPARGATTEEQRYELREAVSIHAPARGATLAIAILLTRGPCFNPRPPGGG